MKKIQTIASVIDSNDKYMGRDVVIYKDIDNEYQVRPEVMGKCYWYGEVYYTDDKQDAMDTAQAMHKFYQQTEVA